MNSTRQPSQILVVEFRTIQSWQRPRFHPLPVLQLRLNAQEPAVNTREVVRVTLGSWNHDTTRAEFHAFNDGDLTESNHAGTS